MCRRVLLAALLGLLCVSGVMCENGDDVEVESGEEDLPTVDDDLGASREGSRTDDEAVEREEEAIKLDGLSVGEMKQLRDSAEKFVFQAEVDRMMKLIINSLYRNKEIFLRELISNASDALDKIRFLSLTDKTALSATEEMSIRIKADKENSMLHITDTGIGMTKHDLEVNLGTIAKSGTTEFFEKMEEVSAAAGEGAASDLIGQFGVGFYSSFLVADTVIVTSKHNEDKQYIWESDAAQFSIVEDPRGDTLLRGTTITLVMKEEAMEYLEPHTLRNLVQKYSQFINFPIYLWESRTETVEEPIEEDDEGETSDGEEGESGETSEGGEEEEEKEEGEDETVEDEASVEDEESEETEEKPKTRTVEKTVWDWVQVNNNRPIWLRSTKEVEDEEYAEFYKAFTKDSQEPMAKTHFVAEGEVTFRSILFVPPVAPPDMFSSYTKRSTQIKLYVRRVFITDDFEDMLPNYLNFIRGVVDSDDLPLNVSREMLQQHKLLKVIKKKLVRKALDMFKKMDEEDYKKFWEQFSTNIKLGIMEDSSNKTRLAKLLRFQSSNDESENTSLEKYIERMREKQEHIYFMAAPNRAEAEASPFVERLQRKGYEVLYLVDPVDEYALQNLPEFEGKKFQNVAKEGLEFGDEGEREKEQMGELEELYKPLTEWLKDEALAELIDKAVVSNRLSDSPCALVASQYGWSGNMERIMRAQAYAQGKEADFYTTQKKTMEINPRHPLIKELQRRISEEEADQTTVDLAHVLYETAVLRSGYALKDSSHFAGRIERMLRLSLGVDVEAPVEEEEFYDEEEEEDDEEEIGDEEEEEEEEEGESASESDTEESGGREEEEEEATAAPASEPEETEDKGAVKDEL